MTSRDRKALWITAAVVLLFSLTGGMMIASLGGSGMIEVSVEGRGAGTDLKIAVPAVMAVVGIACLPNDLFSEIDGEAIPYIALARRACEQLEETEDFVMVEVRDGPERVLVSKKGDRLVVDVRDRNEKVRVSVPLGVASRVLKKIEKGRVIL